MWFDGSGNQHTFEQVVQACKNYNARLSLGTDSQINGQMVTFATAICMPGDGHGGKFFIQRQKQPRSNFRELRTRLTQEVQFSLDTATSLQEQGVEDFEIHIDVSPSMTRHGSAKAAEMLRKYVQAYGIEYKIKPEAWASGSVADRYVR